MLSKIKYQLLIVNPQWWIFHIAYGNIVCVNLSFIYYWHNNYILEMLMKYLGVEVFSSRNNPILLSKIGLSLSVSLWMRLCVCNFHVLHEWKGAYFDIGVFTVPFTFIGPVVISLAI